MSKKITIIFNKNGIDGNDILALNIWPTDKITTYIHNSELYGHSFAKLVIKVDDMIIFDMDMNDYFNESWATKDLLERDATDIANDYGFDEEIKEEIIEFFTLNPKENDV
ncbi:MAG: hypothetical protein EOM37_17805 [Proteobacteria bacterium]|nr:hypothetical protein [Pseudomonadota bacterium]